MQRIRAFQALARGLVAPARQGAAAASRLVASTASAQAPARNSTARTWGAGVGLGFAASLGLGISTATATSAPGAESVAATVDGTTISVPGGAKLQHKIVFVLGGPGSGKGTQCARLIEEFPDLVHFSAGDLLRDHIKSGTADGNMVADMIKNGQIVPAEITVGLLQSAMAAAGKHRVLIDGFPRNADNKETFIRMVGYDAALVLSFECPEEVLEQRLLSRNQGRSDDNIETIKKRFRVFLEQSMPVIASYETHGKVARIDTNRPVDEIYKEVRRLITEL